MKPSKPTASKLPEDKEDSRRRRYQPKKSIPSSSAPDCLAVLCDDYNKLLPGEALALTS